MSEIKRARTWRTLVAAILAGSTSALFSAGASAASFERLPDGRIVLTALGEKFAFRERDLDRVDLYWPEYPCKPAPTRLSLALWREDPVVAACLNKIIPDDFPPGSRLSLTLRVQFTFEGGERYPEKGKRIEESLTTGSILHPGQLTPGDLPDPPRLFSFIYVGVLHVNKDFRSEIPADGNPDALGFQAHRVGKLRPFYRLPADRRIGMPIRSLDVACSDIESSHCSISLKSADGYVGLGLEWLGPSPRSGWPIYDAAARKIANAIFVARTPGDIQ